MIKNDNQTEKYILIGEHVNAPKYIGGEIKVRMTQLEESFKIEGTISRENQLREVKGFASYDTIDRKLISLMLFEHPIQEGANNTLYYGEVKVAKEFKPAKQLDSSIYGEIKTEKVLPNLAGTYKGSIFPQAKLELLDDDELLEEFVEVLADIDFDQKKRIPIKFTLQKN